MDYLLSIAQPDIVIISTIAPNHLEQFGTIEKYRSEKLKIVHRAKHCIIHESLRQYIDRDVVYYSL
jgi:UDP-N-acetylmuramyl pentapeptide synthase